MALTYKGNWALNTQYYIDDYVTDASNDSGEGAGTLLYCIVNNLSSSTILSDDWDASYWSTRSGTNSYYNNSVTDGGPQLIEGTLAKATEVENKFTAVAKGFDEFAVVSGNPLSLTATDYNTTGRILDAEIAERANKAVGFDVNGDVVAVALKGEYKGDWTTATIYALGDTVKDTANVFGSGVDSILVAITAHTSTGVGDTAYWETWVDTGSLQTLADEAAASAAAALVSENNAETAETNAETAETNAELSEWEAEAARQTSDNYAITAEDTVVSTVSSDGDGTYTSTPTTDYSALHWAAKSADSAAGGVATVVGGTNVLVDSADANNPIVNVAFTPFDARYSPIATYDYSTTISGATVFDEIDVTDGQVTNVSTRELTAANIGALSTTGKAADSDKLDNLNSTQFVRSDATDTISGTLTSSAQIRGITPVSDSDLTRKDYVDGDMNLTSGNATLPGGLIIQWGEVTTNATGDATITYPIAVTAMLSIVLTGADSSALISCPSFGSTTATVKAVQSPTGASYNAAFARWIAVGR